MYVDYGWWAVFLPLWVAYCVWFAYYFEPWVWDEVDLAIPTSTFSLAFLLVVTFRLCSFVNNPISANLWLFSNVNLVVAMGFLLDGTRVSSLWENLREYGNSWNSALGRRPACGVCKFGTHHVWSWRYRDLRLRWCEISLSFFSSPPLLFVTETVE